ncbi:MAG: cryptochrome/photolyase family protein, partial [Pseudomonadota bacterium]
MSERRIVLILGDQLSADVTSLKQARRERDVVLIAEVADEATYVRHHKKKIALVFSAMRHFADHLRQSGWTVDYVRLDDAENTGSLVGEVRRAVARRDASGVTLTEPGEWRLRQAFVDLDLENSVPVALLEDHRFLCSRNEFRTWASSRSQLRMEFFYREMRRKTGLLMDGDKPVGGKWNFDSENRKPAKGDLFMPAPLGVEPDQVTCDVLDLVAKRFDAHFGDLEP